MEQKTITRRQVIKALRTEPLQSGEWCDGPTGYTVPAKNLDCTVCAVGAVLRQVTDMRVEEIYDFGAQLNNRTDATISDSANQKDISLFLADGNYLAALSAYFESTIPDKAPYGKRHRERLVKFVKKNFPTNIPVTYEQ